MALSPRLPQSSWRCIFRETLCAMTFKTFWGVRWLSSRKAVKVHDLITCIMLPCVTCLVLPVACRMCLCNLARLCSLVHLCLEVFNKCFYSLWMHFNHYWHVHYAKIVHATVKRKILLFLTRSLKLDPSDWVPFLGSLLLDPFEIPVPSIGSPKMYDPFNWIPQNYLSGVP